MAWSVSITWLVWLPMFVFEVTLALWFLIKGVALPAANLSLLPPREYKMKAILYHKYSLPDVLELCEIDMPVPAEDEVLVHVYASSLNPADWYGMIGIGIG